MDQSSHRYSFNKESKKLDEADGFQTHLVNAIDENEGWFHWIFAQNISNELHLRFDRVEISGLVQKVEVMKKSLEEDLKVVRIGACAHEMIEQRPGVRSGRKKIDQISLTNILIIL